MEETRMPVAPEDRPLPRMPRKRKPRNRNARLGYEGEHPVEVFLRRRGWKVYRPRAGGPHDHGDIIGLPVTVSVKNWETTKLAHWCREVAKMKEVTGQAVGIVW